MSPESSEHKTPCLYPDIQKELQSLWEPSPLSVKLTLLQEKDESVCLNGLHGGSGSISDDLLVHPSSSNSTTTSDFSRYPGFNTQSQSSINPYTTTRYDEHLLHNESDNPDRWTQLDNFHSPTPIPIDYDNPRPPLLQHMQYQTNHHIPCHPPIDFSQPPPCYTSQKYYYGPPNMYFHCKKPRYIPCAYGNGVPKMFTCSRAPMGFKKIPRSMQSPCSFRKIKSSGRGYPVNGYLKSSQPYNNTYRYSQYHPSFDDDHNQQIQFAHQPTLVYNGYRMSPKAWIEARNSGLVAKDTRNFTHIHYNGEHSCQKDEGYHQMFQCNDDQTNLHNAVFSDYTAYPSNQGEKFEDTQQSSRPPPDVVEDNLMVKPINCQKATPRASQVSEQSLVNKASPSLSVPLPQKVSPAVNAKDTPILNFSSTFSKDLTVDFGSSPSSSIWLSQNEPSSGQRITNVNTSPSKGFVHQLGKTTSIFKSSDYASYTNQFDKGTDSNLFKEDKKT